MAHYSKIFVSTDAVVFRFKDRLETLLIQRGTEPYAGKWALPGGHLEESEAPEVGCARELLEETGISAVRLVPLLFYGDVNRDPRYRNISLSFIGLTQQTDGVEAATDAKQVRWAAPTEAGELAFDHNKVLSDGLRKLRHEANQSDILRYVLGDSFSLNDLQKIYEELFLLKLDRRNFRRKISNLGVLQLAKVPGSKNRYKFKSDYNWAGTLV